MNRHCVGDASIRGGRHFGKLSREANAAKDLSVVRAIAKEFKSRFDDFVDGFPPW
jgi:hypothetical protein